MMVLLLLPFRNVSEKLHRGRQTQEAGRFAAVIEAIRVAGSYGKTFLFDRRPN